MAEILRKITLATCGANIKAIKDAVAAVKEGEVVPVLRVAGIANGYKPGNTDKGDYVMLLGEFSAINLMSGETFNSAKSILPTFIAENFVPALQQHGNAEFALDIGARRKDTAVAGYEFTMRPLIESKASDRLAALLQTVSKVALPAPTAPAKSSEKSPAKSKSKSK